MRLSPLRLRRPLCLEHLPQVEFRHRVVQEVVSDLPEVGGRVSPDVAERVVALAVHRVLLQPKVKPFRSMAIA